MPSFRATLAVLETFPGVPPPRVLEAGRDGVGAAGWLVEDAFVDVAALAVRRGAPRITIRFLVPGSNDAREDAEAWLAARALAGAVGRVASWSDLRVFRRQQGRWVMLEGPWIPEPGGHWSGDGAPG